MDHSAPIDLWTVDAIPADWADLPQIKGDYALHRKRQLDVVLALLVAPLALALITVLALLVALDGHSPFFAHERIGKDGKRFRCWKIRTMTPDAANRLHSYLALNPIAHKEWSRRFKLAHDPRVTWFGAFLRKTSLDELPQVWNIWRGEMSFVGPRPVVEAELPLYGLALPYYIALRPGLTGLWQVSGRNSVEYAQRVQLDVIYAQRPSLGLDLRILLATFWTVARRTGR